MLKSQQLKILTHIGEKSSEVGGISSSSAVTALPNADFADADDDAALDESVASAYDAELAKAGKESLTNQIQFVDFKPLSESVRWLGIGHSMQARFVWTPTLRALINNTGAVVTPDGSLSAPKDLMLPMIYLDEKLAATGCKSRRSYQCLVIQSCTIGEFDVSKSLSVDFNGMYSVTHKVVEGERMSNDLMTLTKIAQMGISADTVKNDEDSLPGLDFECTFRNPITNANVTITSESKIKVISKAPVPSTAQVIKPTNVRTAVVGTVITVEAVLDQPGLRIVKGHCKINEEETTVAFDLGRGLYTLEYIVREGDTDRPYGKLPFDCKFQDKAGNTASIGPMDLQSWFSVNANPPKFKRVAIVMPGALGRLDPKKAAGREYSLQGPVETAAKNINSNGEVSQDRVRNHVPASSRTRADSGMMLTTTAPSQERSFFLSLGSSFREIPKLDIAMPLTSSTKGARISITSVADSKVDTLSESSGAVITGWAPFASTVISNLAHVGDTVVVELVTERTGLKLSLEKCLLNGIDVHDSMVQTEVGLRVALNITTGQSDWFEGQLPIDCWVNDADGNTAHVTHFTDNNKLAGDAHTPTVADYFPNVLLAVGFAVVSVASGQIAHAFPHIGLPLITGYLLTGILAGPEALGLIPEQSIRSLRFIDELSLAVIAISAGAKLYLPKMSGRWRSIGWVMGGLIVFEYGIAVTIVALHPYIQFMDGMDENQILAAH